MSPASIICLRPFDPPESPEANATGWTLHRKTLTLLDPPQIPTPLDVENIWPRRQERWLCGIHIQTFISSSINSQLQTRRHPSSRPEVKGSGRVGLGPKPAARHASEPPRAREERADDHYQAFKE